MISQRNTCTNNEEVDDPLLKRTTPERSSSSSSRRRLGAIVCLTVLPTVCRALPIASLISGTTTSGTNSSSSSGSGYLLARAESSPADEPDFVVYLLVAVVLILLGGVFAGLTLGIMGQDEVYLKVISVSGTPRERRASQKILELLERGKHWVLVTLLLSNVITNETLPIMLDRIAGGGWQAVLGSTVSIVIFGEIIPQSLCVRYGLEIGAFFQPFILVLMYLMYPVVKPISLLLDLALGESHGTVYKKKGLKTLVTLHNSESTLGVEEPLTKDEITIISAVLDLKEKKVEEIMTPLDKCFTLSCDTVLDEARVEEILNSGFSRIPIHMPENNLDFIGMLLVRILISYDPEDCWKISDFPLATLPETSPSTSCLNILNYFQEGKSHMCVVSESPGFSKGALGVLTLEDVIEELIGEEIVDESDVLRNSPLAMLRQQQQREDQQGQQGVVDSKTPLLSTSPNSQRSGSSRKPSISSNFKHSLKSFQSKLSTKKKKNKGGEGAVTVKSLDQTLGVKFSTHNLVEESDELDDMDDVDDMDMDLDSEEHGAGTTYGSHDSDLDLNTKKTMSQVRETTHLLETNTQEQEEQEEQKEHIIPVIHVQGPQPVNRASDPLKVNKNFVTIKQLPKEFAKKQQLDQMKSTQPQVYVLDTKHRENQEQRDTPRDTKDSDNEQPDQQLDQLYQPQPQHLSETAVTVSSAVVPPVHPELYLDHVSTGDVLLSMTREASHERRESHGGIIESVITVKGVSKTIIEQSAAELTSKLKKHRKRSTSRATSRTTSRTTSRSDTDPFATDHRDLDSDLEGACSSEASGSESDSEGVVQKMIGRIRRLSHVSGDGRESSVESFKMRKSPKN